MGLTAATSPNELDRMGVSCMVPYLVSGSSVVVPSLKWPEIWLSDASDGN